MSEPRVLAPAGSCGDFFRHALALENAPERLDAPLGHERSRPNTPQREWLGRIGRALDVGTTDDYQRIMAERIEPNPESLVEALIDMRDAAGARSVLSAMRKRDASDPLLVPLESSLSRIPEGAAPSPIDERFSTDLAEDLLKRGFVAEAEVVYARLARSPGAPAWVADRHALVSSFLAMSGSAIQGIPGAVEAEALVADRRLASALLAYRALARAHPDNWIIASRAEALRAIVTGPGLESRPDTRHEPPGDPGDTLREALGLAAEGSFREASSRLGSARTKSGPVAELAAALERVAAIAERETGGAARGGRTYRIGDDDLFVLQVRMANIDTAIAILERLERRQPADPERRADRAALEILSRELGRFGAEPVQRDRRVFERALRLEESLAIPAGSKGEQPDRPPSEPEPQRLAEPRPAPRLAAPAASAALASSRPNERLDSPRNPPRLATPQSPQRLVTPQSPPRLATPQSPPRLADPRAPVLVGRPVRITGHPTRPSRPATEDRGTNPAVARPSSGGITVSPIVPVSDGKPTKRGKP